MPGYTQRLVRALLVHQKQMCAHSALSAVASGAWADSARLRCARDGGLVSRSPYCACG